VPRLSILRLNSLSPIFYLDWFDGVELALRQFVGVAETDAGAAVMVAEGVAPAESV